MGRTARIASAAVAVAALGLPARAANDYVNRQPPEIRVQGWVNSTPRTLAGERGNVVLLEFWAID